MSGSYHFRMRSAGADPERGPCSRGWAIAWAPRLTGAGGRRGLLPSLKEMSLNQKTTLSSEPWGSTGTPTKEWGSGHQGVTRKTLFSAEKLKSNTNVLPKH